jgi:uncharacterized protein (DUF2235 family)
MQDWITDNPRTLIETLKTASDINGDDFTVCETCEQKPWFSFFFDGTGNNKERDKANDCESNVARLWHGHGENRPLLVRLYYSGVGTPLNVSDHRWMDAIRDSEMLGGGAGLGSDVRLKNAESEFALALKRNHKVTRIDVAIFGFSRGAALARAFVHRLLKKCEMKDGVPHWPCDTALDGKSAPLRFRFLGLFDTVESVGLPAHNFTDMLMAIPDEVERCVHLAAAHELRAYFPLTPLQDGSSFEEILYPGMHSDVGGGYKPNEQARSDLLPRIALNRMRLEARMAGVPFIAPAQLQNDVRNLFEYDEDVKMLFDEYMAAVNTAGTLKQQILSHMRLYYGWLKARYHSNPCDVYQGVCTLDPEQTKELANVQDMYSKVGSDIDMLTWRRILTGLWKTDPQAYEREVKSVYNSETNAPRRVSEDEAAYLDAWLNPPTLSANLLRFFDQYVHDSRAGFSVKLGAGGYFLPRVLIEASGAPKPVVHPKIAASQPVPVAIE